MKRKSCRTIIACFVFLLLLMPASQAFGKATVFWKAIENLEMVVTSADISTECSDSDINLILRHVEPGEASYFPHVTNKPESVSALWRPWANNWLDYMYKDVLGDHPASDFGKQCQACAGTGTNGAGCAIEYDTGYATNPCPKFFQCASCMYDLNRLTGAGLSNIMTKAEFFIGENRGSAPPSNALNNTFKGFLAALGIIGGDSDWASYGNCYSATTDLCNEFNWSGAEWLKSGSAYKICGTHVLVSGVVTGDEEHHERLEIHPVASLVLASGNPNDLVREYKLGAIGDGSVQDLVHWAASYRGTYDDYGFGDLATFNLAELQGPRPADASLGNGKLGVWDKVCEITEKFKHNFKEGYKVKTMDASGSTDNCGLLKIRLDRHAYAGAAWAATIKVGWKLRSVSFDEVKGKGETNARSVLGEAPPDWKNVKASSECQVPSGVASGTNLKRWYGWEKYTNLNLSEIQSMATPPILTWEWVPNPSDVVVKGAGKKGEPAAGEAVTQVWMPVSGKAPTGAYTANMDVLIRAFTQGPEQLIASESFSFSTPAPSVKLETKLVPTAAENIVDVMVSAKAEGLCGKNWVYAWERTRNGEKMPPLSGKGPHKIKLGINDVEHLFVTVRDEWDVQVVETNVLFKWPGLDASIEAKCEDAKETVVKSPWLPSGPSMGGPGQKLTVCGTRVFSAEISESSPKGAAIPKPGLKSVKIDSFAVDYSTAPNWEGWKPAPSAWLKKRKQTTNYRDTVVVTPKEPGVYKFRATVAASDKFGRKASASVEATTYGSNAKEVAAAVGKLWKALGRADKMPAGDPCGFKCASRGSTTDDWLKQDFSIMLWNLEHPARSDETTFGRLRDYAASVARAMGARARKGAGLAPLDFGKSSRAVGKLSRGAKTKGSFGKKAQRDLLFDAWVRLASDPAFYGRHATPARKK